MQNKKYEEILEMNYKLLTPGPLTTSKAVKEKMMVDHCTWDDDYKEITQEIRKGLLEIAQVSEENYTTVLMQGSGSFGVEAVLTSVVGEEDKILIISNGAYGERIIKTAKQARIAHEIYEVHYSEIPSAKKVEEILKNDDAITHVIMIHCETTSGILNDIESVSKTVKEAGRTMLVDAMSSLGGIEIPVEEWGIDFIISSANKCIQGVPGFSFIVCNREKLMECEGQSRSLSLDIYAQWKEMDVDGKWRFTSPTHVVLAFRQAMEELQIEGGVVAREKRYRDNNEYLITKMKEMGIETYIGGENQSPIITTFLYPDNHNFSFVEMYQYIKERGYAIYPGKVTGADTFRIGNIGEIYLEDMVELCEIFRKFFEEMRGK